MNRRLPLQLHIIVAVFILPKKDYGIIISFLDVKEENSAIGFSCKFESF